MKCGITSVAAALLLTGGASAFTVPRPSSCSPSRLTRPREALDNAPPAAARPSSSAASSSSSSSSRCRSPASSLFMGRAAAVRAATKGKTDAKKAKINGYYGKKIIMAVKQGGSSDPVANRQLADLIKAAKNNSVPVDVSSQL